VSQTWRKSARLLLAAGLVVTLAQSLSPTAASSMPAGASSAGPTTGTAPAEPARAQLLKPNLVALKANDLHVQQTARGRFLRFESGIGNVGRGPIEIRPNTSRPCPTGKHHATQIIYRDVDGSRFYRRDVDKRVARRSAGCMVFHPAHDHWHFQAASRYTLFQPDGDRERRLVTVARRKMSFCLRDSERLPERYGAFHYPEFYGACSKNSPQGISVGWVDIYQSFLAGQALRLPDRARDGLYCLHIAVDPRDELVETDDADNDSTRAFELIGDRIRLHNARRCR
jgi:Lysyl oxidase